MLVAVHSSRSTSSSSFDLSRPEMARGRVGAIDSNYDHH